MRDVLINSCHQFGHAGEHTPAQSFGGDVAEESLDHGQPRGRCRSEVHVEARMFVKPRLHRAVLVRGVVVGDQVQCLVLGRLPINLAQELEPLDVRMPLLAGRASG